MWPEGGPWDFTMVFRILYASIFLTGVTCNYHPLGYAPFDEKKKKKEKEKKRRKKKKRIGPVFSIALISIWGWGENVLPKKSHGNENSILYFSDVNVSMLSYNDPKIIEKIPSGTVFFFFFFFFFKYFRHNRNNTVTILNRWFFQ